MLLKGDIVKDGANVLEEKGAAAKELQTKPNEAKLKQSLRTFPSRIRIN